MADLLAVFHWFGLRRLLCLAQGWRGALARIQLQNVEVNVKSLIIRFRQTKNQPGKNEEGIQAFVTDHPHETGEPNFTRVKTTPRRRHTTTNIEQLKLEQPLSYQQQCGSSQRVVLRISTDLVEEGLGVGYHGGYRNRGVKHHHTGTGIHSLQHNLQHECSEHGRHYRSC